MLSNHTNRAKTLLSVACILLCALSGCSEGFLPRKAEEAEPPEIVIGERLFLETRFAKFFSSFLLKGGGVNEALPEGDPIMDTTQTITVPLPGPFAGRSINCRACHMLDEQLEAPSGGMRTYSDFARRSPLSAREDGKQTATRNSPSLVNASLPREGGPLFHFDGEFASLLDLVEDTLRGRMLGWLPNEEEEATRHIARIIREDDGSGELAQEFGALPYSVLLKGKDPSIPEELRLPEEFTVDVSTASDEEIVEAVAKLIAAYTEDLVFSRDEDGNFNLSPYDVFLEINNLPRKPQPGETNLEYSRRLLRTIEESESALRFVSFNPNTADGRFKFHAQEFRFGPSELEGLKIFFREWVTPPFAEPNAPQMGVGNCIACHPAPNFTDFRFHNTGVTQAEYDIIHGEGAFAQLKIPSLRERSDSHDAYLPATKNHPNALEPFRSVPSKDNPERTDLGLWNVFANPDFPKPQRSIWRMLCQEEVEETLPVENPEEVVSQLEAQLSGVLEDGEELPFCKPSQLLYRTIASFKTPGLRDLGHSAPYMHNGAFDSLDSVISFYVRSSQLAKEGSLRNGARELERISLTERDVKPVVDFLKSLNEDYE